MTSFSMAIPFEYPDIALRKKEIHQNGNDAEGKGKNKRALRLCETPSCCFHVSIRQFFMPL